MPNGRPGDHPLTDILSYGSSNYPEDINALVKQLAQMPGFASIRERVANVLWEDWPAWQNAKPDYSKVRASLLELQRELKRDRLMSREGINDDDWYAGRTVPGGRFRHNESVRVIAGEHAGKFGALISVESLKPEPVYLVELGSGEGDLLLPDSSLAPAE